MLHYLLADCICRQFEHELERHQKLEKEPKCFNVCFNLYTENPNDYRKLEIVLYAPDNYVQVFIRESIANKFEKVCDHDSCWRDTVRDIIFKNRDRLATFRSFKDTFYTIEKVSDVLGELK